MTIPEQRDGQINVGAADGGASGEGVPSPAALLERFFDRACTDDELARLRRALAEDAALAARAASMARVVRALRERPPAPDVREAVLARVDRITPFLDRRSRRLVTAGRAVTLGSVVGVVAGLAIVDRVGPGLFRVNQEPDYLTQLEAAIATNLDEAARSLREVVPAPSDAFNAFLASVADAAGEQTDDAVFETDAESSRYAAAFDLSGAGRIVEVRDVAVAGDGGLVMLSPLGAGQGIRSGLGPERRAPGGVASAWSSMGPAFGPSLGVATASDPCGAWCVATPDPLTISWDAAPAVACEPHGHAAVMREMMSRVGFGGERAREAVGSMSVVRLGELPGLGPSGGVTVGGVVDATGVGDPTVPLASGD